MGISGQEDAHQLEEILSEPVDVDALPEAMVGAPWVEAAKTGKFYYNRRRCRIRREDGKVVKAYLKYLGRAHGYTPKSKDRMA